LFFPFDLEGFKRYLENKNINPDNLTGFDFFINLKDFLTSQGFNLSDLTLGRGGIDQLAALLENLGFDPGKITEFIEELSDNSDKAFSLSDLFTFMENNFPSEERSDDFLDLSANPFLSAILSEYGLSDQDINTILASARIEGQGIDISRLLEKIREMIPNMETGSVSMDADKIENILSKLNLMDEENAKPPASIMEFAVLLSKNVKRKNMTPLDNTHTEKHLQGFLKNLSLGKDQAGLEKSAADLQNHEKNQQTGEFGNKNLASDLSALEGKINKDIGLDKSNGKNKPSQSQVSNNSVQNTQSSETANILKNSMGIGEKALNQKQGSELSDKQSASNRMGFDQIRELALNAGDDNKQTGFDKPQGTRTTPKSLPSHVMNQVNRQLARSLVTGSDNVVINLKPSHLGRLQVNLENTTGSLRVSVVAESQVSRDILASHAQELKQILSEQGLKVEKVNVELSSDFDQFAGNTKDGKYRDNWHRSPGW